MRKGSRVCTHLLRRRRRRPLVVESLESRVVLAAFCELIDGSLNIQCSPEVDQVVVRLDPRTDTVQVLSEEGLIGLFAATDVEHLHVDDLAPGDQVVVDSRLRSQVSVSIDASGNSHGSSDGHEHQQGPVGIITSPLPGVEEALDSAPALVTSDANVGLDANIESEHGLHVSIQAAAHLAHHAARVDPSAGSDAAGVAQGHSHQASASTERQQAAGDQSSLAAGGLFANPDGNKHGDHEAAEIKSKVSADVVEKRCTTTYTGKNALIAYDGERKCDCAKKAKAAEEAAKRAAVDEVVTQTSVWQAPEGACPACLARSLGSVEGEICPAVPAVGGGMPADDLEQAVIDALVTIDSGEVDRSREDSPWQSRLQIAGLTLAAAGVAVIPLVWKRRRDEEQAIDEAWRRDGDWLGGCFHVEALAR